MTFEADTRGKANQAADDWWMKQKGLRQLYRSQVATGSRGPSLLEADRWAVTVHYEQENSN